MADVVAGTSAVFGIPISDMTRMAASRRHNGSRHLARARHVGMYVAADMTGKSNKRIAEQFGRSDHTTVLYARRRVGALLSGNENLQEIIDAVKTAAEESAARWIAAANGKELV